VDTPLAPASPPAGIQVSSRSEILSDPRPSATSNHTIAFTVNNSLDTVGWGSGSDATDTLTLTVELQPQQRLGG
jgi:hypothetical protein